MNKSHLFAFLIISLFMIQNVMCYEFDNTKAYNPIDRSITIKNTFLGLFPTGDVAKITPLTPHINYVIRGNDRLVAEFEVDAKEIYTEGFWDNMEFYNLKDNNKAIDRQFTIKYLERTDEIRTPQYTNECEDVLDKGNLSQVCTKKFKEDLISYKKVWKELDTKADLPKGIITIGIFTDVLPNDVVEFIPTWGNVRIFEYSVWTDSLNVNLTLYYNMGSPDEAINHNYNITAHIGTLTFGSTDCLIGNCIQMSTDNNFRLQPGNESTNVGAPKDISFNFWWRSTSSSENQMLLERWLGTYKEQAQPFYLNYQYWTSQWTGTGLDGTVPSVANTWYMATYTKNSTGWGRIYINGTLAIQGQSSGLTNGAILWFFGANHINSSASSFIGTMDEMGWWDRELTSSEVTQLYNAGAGMTYMASANSCGVLEEANRVYTLSSNVSANGTCFTISAANVTLNCAGYTINYSIGGATATYGIYSNQYNTTVRNCNVVDGNLTVSDKQSKHGIYFISATYGVITGNNVSIYGNVSHGIYLNSALNNTLTSNTGTSNSSYGIYLKSSSNNTLTSNTGTSNSSYGILLHSSSNNNLLTNNTGTSNSYVGIQLGSSSNDNNLINNQGTSNSDYGIYFGSSSNNNLTSNIGTSNSSVGIGLYLSLNNTLTNNTGASNSNYGIYLLTSSNNTLISTTGTSNSSYGIYLLTSSNNNTLTSNNGTSNSSVGIYLYSSSNYNTLTSNTGTSNSSQGIVIFSASNNILTNNTGTSNSSYGIYIQTSSNNTLISNIGTSNSGSGIFLQINSNYNLLTNNIGTSNSSYGIYIHRGSSYNTFINTIAKGYLTNGIGMVIHNASHNIIQDCINISGFNTNIYLTNETADPSLNNTFINCSYRLSKESVAAGNQLIRKWYYQTLVNDTNGNNVSGAVVNATNSSGALQFSTITNSTGWTNITQITDYVNVGGTRNYYSLYTLSATNGTYAGSKSYNVTLNGNKLNDGLTLGDTIPPIVYINSPENITYSSTSIFFNFTLSKAGTCEYSLNNGVTNYTMANVTTDKEFTATNSSIAQGQYKVNAYCSSLSGYRNDTAARSFSIDTILPDIKIVSPANDTTTTDSGIDVLYLINDTHLNSCWYSNNSGLTNYTITCGTNLTTQTWDEGRNVIRIYANDSANNENASSVTFYIDTIAPSLNITSPTNNTNSTDTNLDIEYAIGGDWNSCWYSNDTFEVNKTLPLCANLVSIVWSEGVHNVRVYTNDSAGNENSSAVRFTIDTTNPNINLVYPLNITYNYSITLLNYTVSDTNLVGCWYSLNYGITNTTITCGTNVTTLTALQGNNTWLVGANDSAGNVNQSIITFTLDSTAPTAESGYTSGGGSYSPGVNNSFTKNTQTNFTANVSDNNTGIANITITVTNGTGSVINRTTQTFLGGVFSTLYGVVISLIDGTYTFFTEAYDNVGNFVKTEIITLFVDTTKPGLTSQNYTFIWENDTQNYKLNATIIDVNISSTGIAFNGTNYSVYNITDTVWEFNFTRNFTSIPATELFYFWATDNATNYNASLTYRFRSNCPTGWNNLTEVSGVIIEVLNDYCMERINFTAPATKTRYLLIPENYIATHAYINLSGYYNGINYPENVSFVVGGTEAWYYSGEFNLENNKTNNFASDINSYVNTCTFQSGYCRVPILFISDELGYLRYTDFKIDDLGFIDNAETYNASTYETSVEEFQLNLTYDDNAFPLSEANLIYGGISYAGTKSTSNGNYLFKTSVDIPINSTATNNSFWWQIELTNVTGTFIYSTVPKNQTSYPILLGNCVTVGNTTTLNITAYDEETSLKIPLWNFKSSINYSAGSDLYSKNASFNNLTIKEKLICIDTNITYKLNGIIEYSNTSYETESYYFVRNLVNNITTYLELFLLPSESSTSFILQVNDQDQLPVAGYYIHVNRYYPSLGDYKTVQISKTDTDGKTIGFLHTETVDYQFLIYNENGSLVYTSDVRKIIPETTPYTIIFTIGTPLDSPLSYLENLTGLTYALNYNQTSKIAEYSYTDTNSSFTSASLVVMSLNYSGANAMICNVSSASSTGILSCNLSASEVGSYSITSYIYRGSTYFIDRIIATIENFSSTVGMLGILGAFFILLICGFIFAYNEIAGLVMINVALIFVNLIGLVHFGAVFLTSIVAISIIIGIVLERS